LSDPGQLRNTAITSPPAAAQRNRHASIH
jgi:hypothetical protein